MRMNRFALLVTTTLLTSPLFAGDEKGEWPHWLGPDRDGISKEKGWSVEGAEEPLWEMNVGLGYSTVSIQDGRLFTMGHNEENQEDLIWCLDPLTGEELWAHALPAKIWKRAHGGGTLSTPSADGEVVFASNREGNFFCLDAESGEVRWHKQLEEEYELDNATWGFAASPLVFEKMVVMNSGWVLAFDKKGKLLWKSERDYGDAYSTPAPFEYKKRSCLAVFGGEGMAIIERKSGKELASFEWKTKYDVNAATPLVVGKDRFFISSGYSHGCAMLELKKNELEVAWESKGMATQMSGCVLFEEHLYGFDESKLKCFDLDGEELWAERGLGKSALVIADGKILSMTSRGELVILNASPEGYDELYRKKVLSGGVYWTTPVLLDGLVYCRNSKGDLVCLDHRGADK
jgi:outer membrane protein assembly factor BamB